MKRSLDRYLSPEARAAWQSRQNGEAPKWQENECDYVVVGAGSSGCVIANRLSARKDPSHSVLLLEAGGSPEQRSDVKDFLCSRNLQQSDLDWQLTTQKEPGLGGRRVAWPRGRGLGGSSLLNYMIYMRGSAALYDSWAELTDDPRWSYSQVLELFKRSEKNLAFGGSQHGTSGELIVDNCPVTSREQEFFGAAAEQAGFKNDSRFDFNDGSHSRIGTAGFYQHTVKDCGRWSAFDAFLRPAMGRKNLRIMAHAAVTKVRVEQDRAVAVEFLLDDGTWQRVLARKEIVLCAGAIDSPRMLKLSGIGPAEELHQLGIDVTADLPAVGNNLSDHPVVQMVYPASSAIANGDLPCGGLFLASPEAELDANLQFHPYSFQAKQRNFFCFGVTLVQPRSIGSLELVDSKAFSPARIRANYLSEPADILALRHGVEFAYELASTKSMEGLIGSEAPLHFDGRALDKSIRASAGTLFHPSGSCRMGRGRDCVVDSEMRVQGVKGLRVCDASVFPSPVDGNTNASCILVAERLSDLLLER